MDEVLDSAIKMSQDLADRKTMIDGFADKYIGVTIAIIEAEHDDDLALATAQEWIDVEFEVALDSGSTDNVCHAGDTLLERMFSSSAHFVVWPYVCRCVWCFCGAAFLFSIEM